MNLDSNSAILAIDIGTSSVKAGLLDQLGNLRWFLHDPILSDKAMLGAWDPAIWTASLRRIILAFKTENPGFWPAALVLSGNGPTVVPLDGQGQTLGPALLWIDAKRINLAGNRSFYLPKIEWYRRTYPELYSRTAHFLSCPEYLNFQLTGERYTITPHAGFSPFIWSDVDIVRYGIDPDLLPPWCHPGDAIGTVQASAAQEFGLPQGLPVFAAGSDFMMSLAGTATLSAGMACDRAGSSEGINYCSDKEIIDGRLRTLPHLSPDCWNVAGILASTGLMFEWFRNISGQSNRPYSEMLSEIRALPVHASLPWFIPDHSEASSWEFQHGMFLNLRPEHGIAHLGRAVVESIGFAVRQSIENLRQVGLPLNHLRLCGGQAKNPVWVAMKADITGVAMQIPQVRDAELVGNAMMGFIGLGLYTDIKQAAAAMVRIVDIVEPDARTYAAFTSRYADYLEIQDRMAGHSG